MFVGSIEGVVDATTLGLVAKRLIVRINVTMKLLAEIPNIIINKIYSHLDSMDLSTKNKFLRIKIDDFTSHFETPKTLDCKLGISVCHAVLRACAGKPWLIWLFLAREDFPREFHDSKSHLEHVHDELMMNDFSHGMLSFCPQFNENEWIEMVGYCSWKHLDISTAIEMLENQIY